MRLENYYYEVIRKTCNRTEGVFHLLLRPDCPIYQGHFPGQPVCPGVCNLQLIRECAEQLTGQRMCLHTIHRCRLTAVATPTTGCELTVLIQLQPDPAGYTMQATLSDIEHTYLTLKGILSPVTTQSMEGGCP